MSSTWLLFPCFALALAMSSASPAAPDGAAQGALNSLSRALARMGFQDTPAPSTPVPPEGFRVLSAEQDWARPTPDLSCHTLTPLRIGRRAFTKGIGAHSKGRIVLALDRPYARLRAAVGVDNNWDTWGVLGSVAFVVLADGEERLRTPVCRCGEDPLPVDVDIAGARQLELIVTDAGDGILYDQADWAEARLETAQGDVTYIGDALWQAFPAPFFASPPASFAYGDRPCWQLLTDWTRTEEAPQQVRGGTRYVQRWRDPRTGLEVTLTAVLYSSPPGLELGWGLANRGDGPSELVTDLRSVDITVPSAERRATLVSCSGGLTGNLQGVPERTGFELATTPLGEKTLAVAGGRSSDGDLPFFLLRDGVSGWGLAVGLGWSGQWQATARFDAEARTVSLRAGMEPVHFRLEPGQEVTLPAALLVPFWGADSAGGNALRRLLRTAYQPHLGGRPCSPPVSFNSWFVFNNRVDAAMLREVAAEAAPLGIEYFCLDAGWFDGDFPAGVGNWTINEAKFPDGLKPLADFVHQQGMKFGLWFEPERVAPATRWAAEHPDLVVVDLLDLGRPEARELVLQMLDDLITQIGVDWIRYDFNTAPLRAWQRLEDSEHQGLRQILHINGLYRVLDELMRRHPDLLIEQCAGGGRRMDLETIRRGHTFWKSDDTHHQPLMRFHETGGNFLLPGGLLNTNLRRFSSAGEMAALFAGPLGFGMDFRELTPEQKETLRRLVGLYKELREYINEDYYPLFAQSREEQTWSGWEFVDPAGDGGFFVVYRQPLSPYGSAELRLGGLRGDAGYELREMLTDRRAEATGAELASGWPLALAPDTAQVFLFQRR